jgi:hypothetical protein
MIKFVDAGLTAVGEKADDRSVPVAGAVRS